MRRSPAGRYKPVRQRRDDALARLPWEAVESLVADFYRGQGFAVEHTGTANTRRRTDGGIDLKLRRGDQYLVAECKHWNAYQVPHNDVHELLGIMASERATGAIFVTSGEFTDAARRRVADVSAIELIDGTALRMMLGPLPEPGANARAASFAAAEHTKEPDAYARRPPAASSDAEAAASDNSRRGAGVATHPRRGPAGRRSQARDGAVAVLLKLAFALVMLWFGKQFLDNMTRNLARPPTARVDAAPAATAAPPRPPVAAAPRAPPVAAPAVRFHPAPAMTAAEQRAWERKNAEAMRLLEASTPEM